MGLRQPLIGTIIATLALIGLIMLSDCNGSPPEAAPLPDAALPVPPIPPSPVKPAPPAPAPPPVAAGDINRLYSTIAAGEPHAVATGDPSYLRRVIAADLAARTAVRAVEAAPRGKPSPGAVNAALDAVVRLQGVLQDGNQATMR